MVAQTRGGGSASPSKLKFSEKLVGKGLSTDLLLKKLRALHTELAALDQDRVDTNTLSAARTQLIHTSLLLHKDRGVKAFTACCLADLLRLYAPDAPYTHNELRDIFQFFFRQLSAGLKGADAPYYNEYFHLLESLSTVKSVVLVCDLPNAEELMIDVFRDFFGLVRHDLAKKIEIFMADILVALIDEAQVLPSDILDTILAQFTGKNVGMDNPAHRLAVNICNATADKLQRHVCQYFTDIIISHTPAESDLSEIRDAHELIKQLHRSCPGLLHSVIPQLEEELRVEDVQLRTLATQVLGEMYGDKGGADLVKKYPTTWNVWLLRKNDKSSAVRLALVEAAKGLVTNLSEQHELVEEALQAKLLDPDEKVRAAVCRIYSHLDYEAALHHVSERQLRNVAGRGLDRKHSVRVEALHSIGKLFSVAYPEIESGDPAATQQFAWIPETLLHMSVTTQEVKAAIEPVLAEFVFPLPALSSSKGADVDDSAWTDRLLTTMKFLDEKAVNALLSMSGVKAARPSPYEKLVDCCVANNGGVIDDNEDEVVRRLNIVIQRLSATLPDPQKAADDLHAFAKLNEGRLYKLLKTCMDTQTDLKGLVKASVEFLRRVQESSPAIHTTMSTVLRRASLRYINHSSIPTLVKRLQRGDPTGDGYGTSQAQLSANNAQAILTFVSKHCPALYKPHVGELTKAIAEERNPRLVEVGLQALAAVASWDEKLAPTDKRTAERVMRFVLDSNPRQAKFSARLLAKSKNAEDTCTDVVNTISDDLPGVDPDKLVAHIAVLAEFAQSAPEAFELKSEDVVAFLIKGVLMKPIPPDPDDMDTDVEWVEDDSMTPALRARLLSLKVCRNRCLAHVESESALEIATPVLKMFNSIMENTGSLKKGDVDDPKVKARMRLQAAVSLLQFASVEKFASHMSKQFVTLAITMQDSSYQVRMAFLRKFVALGQSQKLPAHFNIIPFLTVHDPEADIKAMARAYIAFAFRNAPPAMRVNNFEMIFVRLLHLLAHHPDFSLTPASIPEMAKYIDYYLELIASSENIALLYHIAGKAKTVRDSESPAHSENLYALSELAQHIIKVKAQNHSWTLQSYPGKIKLASDILRPLPNAETANKIVKAVYLPAEALDWVKEQAKAVKAAAAEAHKEKTKAERAERKPAAKRKAQSTRANGQAKRAKATARRKRVTKYSEEEEEEESASEQSASEEEEENGDAQDDDAGEAKSVTSSTENEDDRPKRGARIRANAKIKQQTSKKSGKKK